MSELSPRRLLAKRILLGLGGFIAFTLVFVIAVRLAVMGISTGIEANKATGLSAVSWDVGSMLSTGGIGVAAYQKGVVDPWIARSADLHARSSDFDHSLSSLRQIASTHHGYLEDLRTESRAGYGRALEPRFPSPPTISTPRLLISRLSDG